jgi:hypothetical protein
VHPNDEDGSNGCNEDVTGRMDEYETDESTDPRWDALKTLQEKLKNNHE